MPARPGPAGLRHGDTRTGLRARPHLRQGRCRWFILHIRRSIVKKGFASCVDVTSARSASGSRPCCCPVVFVVLAACERPVVDTQLSHVHRGGRRGLRALLLVVLRCHVASVCGCGFRRGLCASRSGAARAWRDVEGPGSLAVSRFVFIARYFSRT